MMYLRWTCGIVGTDILKNSGKPIGLLRQIIYYSDLNKYFIITILPLLDELSKSNNIEVINQLSLSLQYSKDKKATEILNFLGEKYNENEIVAHSVTESLKKR